MASHSSFETPPPFSDMSREGFSGSGSIPSFYTTIDRPISDRDWGNPEQLLNRYREEVASYMWSLRFFGEEGHTLLREGEHYLRGRYELRRKDQRPLHDDLEYWRSLSLTIGDKYRTTVLKRHHQNEHRTLSPASKIIWDWIPPVEETEALEEIATDSKGDRETLFLDEKRLVPLSARSGNCSKRKLSPELEAEVEVNMKEKLEFEFKVKRRKIQRTTRSNVKKSRATATQMTKHGRGSCIKIENHTNQRSHAPRRSLRIASLRPIKYPA